MSKSKVKDPLAPATGPVLSPRFIVALVLMVVGIAWMAYYYIVVRVDPTVFPAPKPGSPAFMADLGDWNYLIGFGLLMIGVSALAVRIDRQYVRRHES